MEGPFGGLTGCGVRIAIVDSGVNPSHPHVEGVAGGIGLGAIEDHDYFDYNGHGTAVAGAIREKAPDSSLFALKVFDRFLTTSIEAIIEAFMWAIEHDMTVINMSLGTASEVHRKELERVVNLATAKNIAIVAAHSASDEPLLPGDLPSVIGVQADWTCPRGTFRAKGDSGLPVFVASPYPRDIPGVPRERNLSGLSFAVANMSGFVARAREGNRTVSIESLRELLVCCATQGVTSPDEIGG